MRLLNIQMTLQYSNIIPEADKTVTIFNQLFLLTKDGFSKVYQMFYRNQEEVDEKFTLLEIRIKQLELQFQQLEEEQEAKRLHNKKLFENMEYTGIDISTTAINFCKENSDFIFICDDFIKMDLDKKFDLIYSHAVV